MTYSALTNRTISTPNKSSRGGARPAYIVLHHMASTGFEGVLRMWTVPTRVGSANYAISNEGQIVGVVPEEQRSWSVSNAAFDSKSITFEIENESAQGWTVSAAAHEATARVVADLSQRYGIPLDRSHVIGHREVYTRFRVGYATACPGALDLDGIVGRARALVAGATPGTSWAGVDPAAPSGGSGNPYFPTRELFAAVQGGYAALGYKLTVDGIFGPETEAVIRDFQSKHGLEVDGIHGPATEAALVAAQPRSLLAVDGEWGPATTAELQRALGFTGGDVDGELGPQTYRALQAKLGFTGADLDGVAGPKTKRALQGHLGVEQDGEWGRLTATALQTRLNAHTF